MAASPSNPSSVPETVPEPVWSIWLAVAFILLWAALMVVIQQSTLVIAAMLSMPAAANLSQDALQAFLTRFLHDISDSPWSVFGIAGCVGLTWLVTFGLIEMYFRNVPRPVLAVALGVKPAVPRWATAAAIPIGILACIVGQVLAQVLQVEDTPGPFDEILKTVPGFIGTAVIALVIAPIAEECFFRGFLFPPLARSLSAPVAILLNGAIFAAAHVLTYADNTALLIPVMLLGIVAATLRSRTGSVVPGILAHFFFNGTSLVLFALNL